MKINKGNQKEKGRNEERKKERKKKGNK